MLSLGSMRDKTETNCMRFSGAKKKEEKCFVPVKEKNKQRK
jgi:hypothetical protein